MPQRAKSPATKFVFARPDLEALFVNEYVIHLDLCKAAMACGVAAISAAKYGRAMMLKTHVQAAIKDALQRKAEARTITQEKVAAEIQRIAMATVGEFMEADGDDAVKVNIMSIMRPEAAAVSEVTTTTTHDRDGNAHTRTRVKLHDKLKALELLGRHLAMFTDRVEVDGLDGLAAEMKAARERIEKNGK